MIFIISNIQLVDLKKKNIFYFLLKAKEIQSTIRQILLEFNVRRFIMQKRIISFVRNNNTKKRERDKRCICSQAKR